MLPLRVPDADRKRDFLRNALAAWRVAHPKQQPGRGRPSEKTKVFEELDDTFGRSQRRVSQGKLIQELAQKFPALHQDTLRKYAKMWRHYHTRPEKLTAQELSWMEKHQDAEAKQAIQTLLNMRVAFPRALSALVREISQLSQEVNAKRSRQPAPKAQSK